MCREYRLIGHQRHVRLSAQSRHPGKIPCWQRLLHQPDAKLGQYRQVTQRYSLVPGLIGIHDQAGMVGECAGETTQARDIGLRSLGANLDLERIV